MLLAEASVFICFYSVAVLIFICPPEHGEVYCMGENKMGQLGLGNQQTAVLVPKKVVFTKLFFLYKY